MVKNTHGGNKSKGFARKNTVKRESALRVAVEEGEIYAQAVKIMGGAIASAIDIDGNPLRAHIRGKFRGRGKRDNFIGEGTWLLVGLHCWEADKLKPGEIRNCDVLEVYSDIDKTRLRSSVTSVNWSRFVANDNKLYMNGEETNDNDIIFTDDTTEEYEQLIASRTTTTATATAMTGIVADEEFINIEDI